MFQRQGTYSRKHRRSRWRVNCLILWTGYGIRLLLFSDSLLVLVQASYNSYCQLTHFFCTWQLNKVVVQVPQVKEKLRDQKKMFHSFSSLLFSECTLLVSS